MGSILNMRGLRIFEPRWKGLHDTQSQPQHDCGQTSSSHPSPTLSHREIESSTDHAEPSSIADMPQAQKVRGETRLKALWNFPPGTPKIIVNFNEDDQGIGRGSQQLSQFLGTITTNNGVPPSRARMFIMTHQRKDGTTINAEAADVINKLEELESQLPEGSQANATRHDVLSQVLGPDTHGRVRTMGLGVTLSRLWPSEKARQQRTENEELRRTVVELKENAKKQDMRFNQLAESQPQSQP